MTVRPTLSECIRMSAVSIGLSPIAILGPFILGIILKGVPLAGILKMVAILALIFATVSLAAGLVMYWRFSRTAWSMDSQGVSGVDSSGTEQRIGWNQIDAVVLSDSEFDPPDVTRLGVQSKATRTEIMARVAGASLPGAFNVVVKYAGPAHPLADWFRPNIIERARKDLVAQPTPSARALIVAIWVALLAWLLGLYLWLLPQAGALEGMSDCEAASWARMAAVYLLLPIALMALFLGKKAFLTYRSRQVPHPGALLFFPARIKRGRTAIIEAVGLSFFAFLLIGAMVAAWHFLELGYIFCVYEPCEC